MCYIGIKERRMLMAKNLDQMTKCKIGTEVLSLLNKHNITAGSKVTITIETLKNGAIKKVEIGEGEE